VIEIVRRVVGHADFFHHPARPEIGSGGKRDDFIELQSLKTISQDGLSAFCSQTLVPKWAGQPPSDFDAWCEMRMETGPRHSYKPDESAVRAQFGSKECEPMLGEMRIHAIHGAIAFSS
jgi:hypothetical protein